MGGPDGYGRAYEDAPTLPAIAPVRPEEPDPLGIPGLDYLPRPAPPPAGPGHRRDRSRPPWAWLTAAAALAVLVALGLVWTISGRTDTAGRRPPAAAPAAATGALPTAGDSEPSPAGPSPAGPSSGGPSPSPTAPPTSTVPPPSATAVVPPPTPRPQLVRVPGVVGDRRSSAEATLRRAGFTVSVQLVPAPSRRQVRRVVAQLPVAGQLAPRGSMAVLLVGER